MSTIQNIANALRVVRTARQAKTAASGLPPWRSSSDPVPRRVAVRE
jgi:hypothetical protein